MKQYPSEQHHDKLHPSRQADRAENSRRDLPPDAALPDLQDANSAVAHVRQTGEQLEPGEAWIRHAFFDLPPVPDGLIDRICAAVQRADAESTLRDEYLAEGTDDLTDDVTEGTVEQLSEVVATEFETVAVEGLASPPPVKEPLLTESVGSLANVEPPLAVNSEVVSARRTWWANAGGRLLRRDALLALTAVAVVMLLIVWWVVPRAAPLTEPALVNVVLPEVQRWSEGHSPEQGWKTYQPEQFPEVRWQWQRWGYVRTPWDAHAVVLHNRIGAADVYLFMMRTDNSLGLPPFPYHPLPSTGLWSVGAWYESGRLFVAVSNDARILQGMKAAYRPA